MCDAVLAGLQIESMESDPYNILGNVRARTANEMLHAFGHIARHESELELPIYAHHGTKDRLANLGVGNILCPYISRWHLTGHHYASAVSDDKEHHSKWQVGT